MATHIHIHVPSKRARDARNLLRDGQKPYVSRSREGWEVLGNKGQVVKTFPGTPAGREAAQTYLKNHFEELTKDAGFTTYDPREYNRLSSKIASLEVEARSESGETRAKTLTEIAKLKRELSKYRGDPKSKDATFIQVLNDPEGRKIVEEIEEITVSLRRKGGKGSDPMLESIAADLVSKLKKKFKYNYGSFYDAAQGSVEQCKKDIANEERLLKARGETSSTRLEFLKEELQRAESRVVDASAINFKGYQLREIGNGKYEIFNPRTGKTIKKGMTLEEAKAFAAYLNPDE